MTREGRRRAVALVGTLLALFVGCGQSERDANEDGDEESGAGGAPTGARGGRNTGGSGNDAGEETGGRGTGGTGNDAGEGNGGTQTGGSGNDAGEENGGGPMGGSGNVTGGGRGGAVIGGGGGMGGVPMGGIGGGPVAGSGVGGSPFGGAGGAPSGGGGLGGAPQGGGSGRGGFGAWGGMAGSLSGSSGSGGMGGASGGGAGGGAGGECLGIAELFPAVAPTGQMSGLTGTVSPTGAPPRSFDGYLLQKPCSTTSCDDCGSAGWVYEGIATGCNSGSLNAVQNFLVGGIPGQRYRVTLHFYGIVEPKNYGNPVTREAGFTRPTNLDTGATPPPFGYANGNPTYQLSDYNTYELHIVDNNGVEVCSYFLNSDTMEGHWTFVLNYERTIDVIGGGRIRMRSYDRNCRSIKNCYAGGSQGPCTMTGCNAKARLVDVSQAMPQPAGLVQPGLGNNDTNSGQWLFIDVTNVSCGQPALACNGM